jgi:chromosome segregation ATPase
MMYQARETENSYRTRIAMTLSQLRTLREFQEQKHKMDERMRELGNIIARERKERAGELGHIHRQLVAQREFYERQLATKLIEADEYATKFNDLDLDRATTKVLQETEHRREELKSDRALTSEVIKRNDQLRHQVQDLEQQRHVLEGSEKNLTTQAVDLKTKLHETTVKREEGVETGKERIDQLKRHLADRIGELNGQLVNERQRCENLQRERTLAEKQLASAEAQRDERLRKTTNLLGVMNEAAIFILTSLEFQQKDPSKDDLTAHSGALNAIIRKMANVGQDLTGIQQQAVADSIQSKGVQTEKPVRKFVMSGNPASSGAQKGKVTKVSEFRKASEYQRVYGKDGAGPTKAVRIGRKPQ